MGDEEKTDSRVDNWFGKISDYVTGGISSFVAFLFFVFAAGAIYGSLAISKSQLGTYLIIAPAIIGLIAYYNRGFSIIMFAGIILVFVVL